jgi:secondary thiamine-phosphate synthase enzyme
MLRQFAKELIVKTRSRGFYEITTEVQRELAASKIQTGLATLHVQHTSASLIIQENADPEVRRDFERFFARLVPEGDPIFRHTSEGDDDMPAHIRSALTSVNLSVPILDSRLALGTWQGIFLWEHRTAPHSRRIILHLLGE